MEAAIADRPAPIQAADFFATSEGLALTIAYMHIQNAKLRRSIVDFAEQIAAEQDKH